MQNAEALDGENSSSSKAFVYDSRQSTMPRPLPAQRLCPEGIKFKSAQVI